MSVKFNEAWGIRLGKKKVGSSEEFALVVANAKAGIDYPIVFKKGQYYEFLIKANSLEWSVSSSLPGSYNTSDPYFFKFNNPRKDYFEFVLTGIKYAVPHSSPNSGVIGIDDIRPEKATKLSFAILSETKKILAFYHEAMNAVIVLLKSGEVKVTKYSDFVSDKQALYIV